MTRPSADLSELCARHLLAVAGEGRNVVRERGRRRRKRDKRKLEVGVDIPTPEEVSRLLNTAAGRFRPFLITTAYTGMRASELRGLRWCDVNFDTHEINVRQRADRFGNIGEPKSEAGTRKIPVGPFVMNTLREWRKNCEENELDLVFPGKDGGVLDYMPTRRSLHSLMKDAGVVTPDGKPKYTGLHALRHFYASWLMNRKEAGGRGLLPQEAQSCMGHATLSMTVDTYGHLFPRDEDSKEIAAAEDALLSLAAG